MFDLQPFPLDGHAYRIRDIPERDGARIWAGLHAVSPHLMVPVEIAQTRMNGNMVRNFRAAIY